MFSEMATSLPWSINKYHFKEYLTLFPEGKEPFVLGAAEKAAKANPFTQTKVLSASL